MSSASTLPATTAQLFRNRADFREEMAGAEDEMIGEGDLAKMVRLALGDPDGDLWRYSIRCEARYFRGDEIRGLKA